MTVKNGSVVLHGLADLRATLKVSAAELLRHSNVSRSTVYNADRGKPIKHALALKILDSLLVLSKENNIERTSDSMVALKNLHGAISNYYTLDKPEGVPIVLTKAKKDFDTFFLAKGHIKISRANRLELREYLEEKIRILDDFNERRPLYDIKRSVDDSDL